MPKSKGKLSWAFEVLYDFHFKQHARRIRVFFILVIGGTVYGLVNTLIFERPAEHVSWECMGIVILALLLCPFLFRNRQRYT